MKTTAVIAVLAGLAFVGSPMLLRAQTPGAEPTTPALQVEVKKLAASLRGSKAELLKLKPTSAQIARIAATDDDAKLLAAYTEKLFAGIPDSGLDGKPDQTEILVTSGDSLPGGYAQQAVHLRKGLLVYGFKYVAPGSTTGMAYDGLVKLGDSWVMIPKMWRAFAK